MKIKKTKLKQIIKEELENAIENPPTDNSERAIPLMLDFVADRMLSEYDDEVPLPLQKMIDLINDGALPI